MYSKAHFLKHKNVYVQLRVSLLDSGKVDTDKSGHIQYVQF